MKRLLAVMVGVVAILLCSVAPAAAGTYLDETISALHTSNVYISPLADNIRGGAAARLGQQLHSGDYIAIAVLPAAAASETGGNVEEFARQAGEAVGRDIILVVVAGDTMAAVSTDVLSQGVAARLAQEARAGSTDTETALAQFISKVHTYQDSHTGSWLTANRIGLLSGVALVLVLSLGFFWWRRSRHTSTGHQATATMGTQALGSTATRPEPTQPHQAIKPLGASDPQRVGDYKILGLLGAGGMGQVYLAQARSGRKMALKVIASHLAGDAGFRSRFGREITAARRVSGAYTAAVVDADPDAEPPWIATEYIDAPSLDKVIRRLGPPSLEDLKQLMAGLAEALKDIHRCHIVHRDLKPANILWSPGANPRVIDFGIAQLDDATALTGIGFIGTLSYASPEHVSDEPVGPQSDIFSLGSIMVFASTGRPPFGEDTIPRILNRVLNNAPAMTGVPPELYSLIERCLKKQPEQRPTPQQILEELYPA